ncbi:MAG: hypothetical protein ABGZ17_26900, partial [Planctomycetaceae bacterium]
ETVDINAQTIAYLNRLSDLLFVLARFENLADKDGENDLGCGEVLWRPGHNRTSDGVTNGKDEHGA